MSVNFGAGKRKVVRNTGELAGGIGETSNNQQRTPNIQWPMGAAAAIIKAHNARPPAGEMLAQAVLSWRGRGAGMSQAIRAMRTRSQSE